MNLVVSSREAFPLFIVFLPFVHPMCAASHPMCVADEEEK